MVLWIAASHGVPAWNAAPRLVIKAPEKRCGKSRLLDLIEALCHRPIMTTNASPSAVYRSIGQDPTDPPTLLIDEADAIFGPEGRPSTKTCAGCSTPATNAAGPRCAGTPAAASSTRSRPSPWSPSPASATCPTPSKTAPSSSPCAAAPPTNRSSPTGPAAMVQPCTSSAAGSPAGSAASCDQLADAAPAMPVEDRAADTWEPLVAIADAAGGHWPDHRPRRRARPDRRRPGRRPTCRSRVRLLIDCRTAFGDADGLPTATLLDRLRADDEAPWATLGKAGLTAARPRHACSREFGITSANRRWPDGSQTKGYLADDFADSWRRYCPPTTFRRTYPSQPSRRPTA